nr:hypothetical protein [Rubrobacteraceae bacterium]
LVQAAVMVGVDYLCLAVANVYRYRSSGRPTTSRDYANTLQVAEAIYDHTRLRLSYNLVLISYWLRIQGKTEMRTEETELVKA